MTFKWQFPEGQILTEIGYKTQVSVTRLGCKLIVYVVQVTTQTGVPHKSCPGSVGCVGWRWPFSSSIVTLLYSQILVRRYIVVFFFLNSPTTSEWLCISVIQEKYVVTHYTDLTGSTILWLIKRGH